MSEQTTIILSLIIPGLVAVIGNILFYVIIKGRIDRSIEKYKISYSGIYKEKIEIHKTILKYIFGLKLKIQRYQYTGDEDLSEELFNDFNDFVNHYSVNQPFLRTEILTSLKIITKELQSCFEDFYEHNSLSKMEGIEPGIKKEGARKFFKSGNKFKKDEPFKQIEELIIQEMKLDLKIEY